MKLKEFFLGAGSMMQGSAAFIYLMMPENWAIIPSYVAPEASLLKVINGNPWIIIGNTSATIVAENKDKIKRPIELNVKVDDRRHPKNLGEWLAQEEQKIRRKPNSTLTDARKVKIGKHEGAYIAWVEKKRRLGLVGRKYEEAKVQCLFECEDTNREILLKMRTEYPDVLLEKNVPLKRILCSVACHDTTAGKEEEPEEE